MVISAGKSRKNIDAYVLIPPDAKEAIDTLVETRDNVGVPEENKYLFARFNANTPLTGHRELREIADSLEELKHPERINSRLLRRYIATVCQVCKLL